MSVPIGVVYDKVVENSQDINKLHSIIQNSITGDLVISDDDFKELSNNLFGSEITTELVLTEEQYLNLKNNIFGGSN